MKILFINTVPLGKNGISTFIINSALFLNKYSNFKVTIAVFNRVDVNLTKVLKKEKISINKLPSRKKRTINYFVDLVRLIKKDKFDIVYVHGNSTSMFIELFAAFLGGCKVRATHSHNTKTEHPLINKLLRPLFEILITDRIACSKEAGRWLYNNKKFITINNGIIIKNYTPNVNARNRIRKLFNLNEDNIVLGNIGGLNYQKNQEFLIELVKHLDSRYKLILIGNGPNYDKLKKIIKNEKLEDRVFLIGEVNNTNDYLSAFDVFVMPSRYEGLPFALIEAQASGLVCLVSDSITNDSNLTNNVYYASIKNIDFWIKFIQGNSELFKFRNRVNNISEEQTMIRNAGYDSKKNSLYLASKLSKML